jgi:hypothetical protein
MDENKTDKQKIIEMLHRLPDDIDYDRAIEGIYVLQKVELARAQVHRGEVLEDEDVMSELLGDDEEISAPMDTRSAG